MSDRHPDPRLVGTLIEIQRSGYETADPNMDVIAVARGLAYRLPGGQMRLTAWGKRMLRQIERRS